MQEFALSVVDHHSVRMGKALLDSGAPGVAPLFARASELLGYDLLKLCVEGPMAQLSLTRYSQPAIFVVSLAAMAKMRHEQPEAVARAAAEAGASPAPTEATKQSKAKKTKAKAGVGSGSSSGGFGGGGGAGGGGAGKKKGGKRKKK